MPVDTQNTIAAWRLLSHLGEIDVQPTELEEFRVTVLNCTITTGSQERVLSQVGETVNEAVLRMVDRIARIPEGRGYVTNTRGNKLRIVNGMLSRIDRDKT